MKKNITKMLCLLFFGCIIQSAIAQFRGSNVDIGENQLKGAPSTYDNLALLRGKQNIIHYEGFDAGIPSTWAMIDADGDGYTWYSGASGTVSRAYLGANFATSESFREVALTPDNWLISPAITLDGASLIQYYVGAQDERFPSEHYGIYISTSGTATTDFTLLLEETIVFENGTESKQGNWNARAINYTHTGPVYIAFRHFNSTDQFRLNIDEFSVVANTEPSPDEVGAPQLLEANILDNNAVQLNWFAPNVTATWLTHCTAGIKSGFGAVSPFPRTYSLMSRWLPTQLQAMGYTDGYKLTRIGFMPYGIGNMTFRIKVYQGATSVTNPGTEIATQDVTINVLAKEWNEITLDQPITIDPTKELWFGVEVTQTVASRYGAGYDNSTANPGSSVLQRWDGQWLRPTDHAAAYSGNLMLKALVTNAGSQNLPVEGSPIIKGYKVYCDGVLIGFTQATSFTYEKAVFGHHEYCVKTVYESGVESESACVSFVLGTNQCYQSIPLNEGFENNGTTMPACWGQEQITGTTNWNVIAATTGTPNTAHSGSYKARLYGSTKGHVTKLIMPTMDLSCIEEATLSFWHVQRLWNSNQDKLRVYYKNAPDGEWVLLDEYLTEVSDWTEHVITLPNLTSTYWIAFEGTVDFGYGCCIDDISVVPGNAHTPRAGTSSIVATVAQYNVDLEWTPPTDVTGLAGYNLFRDGLKISGNELLTSTTYSEIIHAAGTYTYEVEAVWLTGCKSAKSSTVAIVSDPPPCYAPEDITVTMLYNGNCGAQLSWTPSINGGNLFNIYRDGVSIAMGISATTYVDNGFSTGEHTWCVKTSCDDVESGEICTSGTCTIPTYTITASAGANGTISPSGSFTITYGESKTFSFVPNTGYKIAQILVDGVNNTTAVVNGSYTFSNVTANHTISAEFDVATYTIAATSGSGGSISPAGTATVTHGNNQTYTITADAGYKIKSVLVDGTAETAAVGASSYSYTFSNVTANHTISAEFEQNIFTITATADANGTIAPNGATTLTYGETQEYTITANEGYKIKSVSVDDVAETAAVGASSYSYTFSNVTANHTISAEFEQITYTITATAGANGTIAPSGVTTVSYGSNQAYTITANNDYLIKEVKVDGVAESAAVGKTTYNYTFNNVKANHTISATFEIANPELTGITVNNQPQTISSAMDYMAACGEQSVSMTLTAVGEVKVNGAAYTNGSPISLTGDKTVITITVTAGSNIATYTLTVAKALGSTTPLYIERWGATLAIVNNPANNGGYTFDQIQWYKASDNTPAGTGAYVVGNISTHYADVHAVETGAWHHTCRTKATPAPVQIVVYPNPVLAAQTLNVKLPEGLNEVNIDVYDINGKLVKQHPRVTTTLTAPTGTGIYVLKIQLPDGSITTEKIVVK